MTTKRCRVCDGPLDSILCLGDLLVSGFPESLEIAPPKAPLDWCQCRICGLVQLGHTVPADQLFRDQYWYRSGVNETMRAELADVVEKAVDHVGMLRSADVVLDVGANDGTLLAEYPLHAHYEDAVRIGIEPAKNLYATCRRHCDVLVADFFPQALAQLPGIKRRVKILTSIACFYDLDDPLAFVEAVAAQLHPDGVWVVQFQDLDAMIRATAFDNIVHEHLFYPGLAAIERMIAPFDLKVVDAERRTINGGSLRLTIQHARADRRVADTVQAQRLREAQTEFWQTLERFAWRVGQVRAQITAAIGSLATQGPIDLYGASTKFNTLAQYCGLDGTVIRQAWERSPEKWGRQTITGIPIVSEDQGRRDPPAALLAGIWQFRDAILEREAAYLQAGGTIVFPLPSVDIIGGARS